MNLDKVTSLFDLEQKAKANRYYKQLALLCIERMHNRPIYGIAGKAISDASFQTSFEQLCAFTGKNCSMIVDRINGTIPFVKEEYVPKPIPPVETSNSYQDPYSKGFYKKVKWNEYHEDFGPGRQEYRSNSNSNYD